MRERSTLITCGNQWICIPGRMQKPDTGIHTGLVYAPSGAFASGVSSRAAVPAAFSKQLQNLILSWKSRCNLSSVTASTRRSCTATSWCRCTRSASVSTLLRAQAPFAKPFRSTADLDRLRHLDAQTDTPYVIEAVKILVGELDVPLIGFAGAPFTLASYLIEGGPSRHHTLTKKFMYENPNCGTTS